MLSPESFEARSQDLTEMYHDAGQFYWGKASSWLTKPNIFSAKSAPLLILLIMKMIGGEQK